MSKHKEMIRLEDEINILMKKAEDTRSITVNTHYAVLNNTRQEPLLAKRHDYIIPDIVQSIHKYYTSDSEIYEPSEYHAVYMGIATELTRTLEDMNRKGIRTPCVVDNYIDLALRDAYPDPNRFLLEYNDFRAWQLDGSEPEAGTFWICTFPELGNILSHIEDLKKIHAAYRRSIKAGNMLLALQALKIYSMIRKL